MAAANPPKETRRRRNVPVRGEWQPAVGVGWQYSQTPPEPPEGLKPASIAVWATWMHGWFASHWTPDDLPGLRVVILTYDQVERGEFQRGPELRLLMDTYGITPKGQQDRRWAAPKREDVPDASDIPLDDPYRGLRAV
jgi:hypothetical protein